MQLQRCARIDRIGVCNEYRTYAGGCVMTFADSHLGSAATAGPETSVLPTDQYSRVLISSCLNVLLGVHWFTVAGFESCSI